MITARPVQVDGIGLFIRYPPHRRRGTRAPRCGGRLSGDGGRWRWYVKSGFDNIDDARPLRLVPVFVAAALPQRTASTGSRIVRILTRCHRPELVLESGGYDRIDRNVLNPFNLVAFVVAGRRSVRLPNGFGYRCFDHRRLWRHIVDVRNRFHFRRVQGRA